MRYLRGKGCSIRQLTAYTSAQGVAVHLATVAGFRVALKLQAGDVAPALTAPGLSADLPIAEVSPPSSQKPYVFQQSERQSARSMMVRLRAKDSGNVGRATLVRQMLAPRLGNCPIFFVEFLNEIGSDTSVPGRDLYQLLAEMALREHAIVDIGSSTGARG